MIYHELVEAISLLYKHIKAQFLGFILSMESLTISKQFF